MSDVLLNYRDPWPHVSYPPAGPVKWSCHKVKGYTRDGRPVLSLGWVTEARTWFEARTAAMRRFRCGPDEVKVLPK